MRDPWQEVFDEQELLEITCGLIRCQSVNPPGYEEVAARYIYELLQREGINAEMQWPAPGRPNLTAILKGQKQGPRLLFNGHLDVVPAGENWSVDPFSAVIQDGSLIGRGAADMKSGVAAMLYAAICLHRRGNPFAGELILLFNADEERVNLGMRHFLEHPIAADYAVIGEPTELDICIAHKGIGRYRVRTSGIAAHAGKVKEPDNAIAKMALLIGGLEPLRNELQEQVHPLLGSPSLNVTQIKGGTAPNIVPQSCEIEIDRRVIPGETRESVLEQLSQVIASVAAAGGFVYEIKDYLFIPATMIEQDHPLVLELANAVKGVRGTDPEVTIFEASCEAPFLSVNLGIPTVIFGPGSLLQAHVKDEYVPIAQLIEASKIYRELAMSILQ
ncbi:M20 family metallopeptidase [Paenibacillus jiagnxiensis]|uniref:M20 family metallopeptidase n=1 Tax=Paenibacillus jiagnxiensis TaxID=3228926 RepID=UPI0033B8489E